MLERTDAITNGVLEPITFVLAYPTVFHENNLPVLWLSRMDGWTDMRKDRLVHVETSRHSGHVFLSDLTVHGCRCFKMAIYSYRFGEAFPSRKSLKCHTQMVFIYIHIYKIWQHLRFPYKTPEEWGSFLFARGRTYYRASSSTCELPNTNWKNIV
jgi:hypothetical protein